MEKVQSKDGTLIAYERGGTGPPLVLVHGTIGSSMRWPILSTLQKQFTTYAIDRRGRRESGDADNYAVEREFEDIAAVVDSIGDAVNLLGHSFGGLCVIETALRTSHVRSLIAYEPDPIPGPAVLVDRIQTLLDGGNREKAVITFLQDVVEMPPDEIKLFKDTPSFQVMLESVHTVPREQRAADQYRLEQERFKHLNIPILLMLGGDSPQIVKQTVETWHAALPNSRVVELPGQQHVAHYAAPDLFVREVQKFLTD